MDDDGPVGVPGKVISALMIFRFRRGNTRENALLTPPRGAHTNSDLITRLTGSNL